VSGHWQPRATTAPWQWQLQGKIDRMRLLPAIRPRRQGGLRGRVRTEAAPVLQDRPRDRLQRDPQVLRPLRKTVEPLRSL